MKSILKFLLPLIVVGAGAALFVSLKASRQEPAAMQAPEKQWAVAAETVARADIRPLVRLYGRVESAAHSTLSAAVESEVLAVSVSEGDAVRGGQLLAALDGGDLELMLGQRDAEIREIKARIDAENIRVDADRKALDEEQALLALARRNLERAERLARTQAGSEAGVDEARQIIRSRSLAVVQRQRELDEHPSRVAQLEAALAGATAARATVARDFARTRIHAPFDGRVVSVAVSEGERVRPGDPLLTLYDSRRLRVRAQIPERHLPAVRGGLEGDAALDAVFEIENRDLPMLLSRLSASITAGDGGLDGFFRFDGRPEPSPEVGRVGILRLRMPPVADAISIPAAALYDTDTVYRVIDGRLQPVAVEYIGEHPGEAGEPRLIVRSRELDDGDSVVATQIPAAVAGLKVTVGER